MSRATPPSSPAHRRARGLVSLLLAAACLAAACDDDRAAVPPAAADPATGVRTTIEHAVDGHPFDGRLVVEVVEGVGGVSAAWSAVAPPEPPRLLAEEVVLDGEHFVQVAAAEGVLLDRAAWMRFDTSDARHLAFLAEHRLGLVEQRHLWDAGVGDDIDGDVVRAVDLTPDGARVLRTVGGARVTVRRTRLSPAPVIAAPDSLPIVPFEHVERLVVSSG